MPSTTDYQPQDRGIFALFKGESGAGKSVGALSFPKSYVLDHDRKMPAISLKHFPGKDVSWDYFHDIFEVSNRLCELHDNCPYETIICDTITSLSYTALTSMDSVKGTDIIKRLAALRNDSKKTIELRGFDYYNTEDDFLKYYIDFLKNLWVRPGNPKHVLVCAHVLASEQTNIVKGITTKTRRIVTAGSKIAAYIPAQFDDVWLFATKAPTFGDSSTQTRRIVVTDAVGDDSAKTAYQLPEQIDFTNGSLYQEIQNILGHNQRALAKELSTI